MRLELNLSDEQLQHLRSTLEHQAKHARMYQIRYVHKACDADMQAWRMVEIWSEGILAQLSAEETKENEPEETEETKENEPEETEEGGAPKGAGENSDETKAD